MNSVAKNEESNEDFYDLMVAKWFSLNTPDAVSPQEAKVGKFYRTKAGGPYIYFRAYDQLVTIGSADTNRYKAGIGEAFALDDVDGSAELVEVAPPIFPNGYLKDE
jgi:hypothetical protein